MNRRLLIVIGVTVLMLSLFSAISSAEPAAVPLPVANVDGTWSNPVTGGSIDCLSTENTPGDETDENKIHAGSVNGDSANCYTDSPYNAAPYNGGLGYDEGSGFGFDGSNGILNVAPGSPFLLGLFTHYNRRISSDSGISGAQIDIAVEITGASPETSVFQWDITLIETPNNPDNNPGDICPYPEGSYYGAGYLAFNGGYADDTDYPFTFGTPFDHSEVNGNPPIGERSDNWLCGDKITGVLSSPVETTFTYGGTEYTITILGTSYPTQNIALNGINDVPADVCGTFDSVVDTSWGLETKELEATQGCIWAQFTTPTAIGLSERPRAAQAPAPSAAIFSVFALAGLILIGLLLRQRNESGVH